MEYFLMNLKGHGQTALRMIRWPVNYLNPFKTAVLVQEDDI